MNVKNERLVMFPFILFFCVVNFACYYHVLIPASLKQDVKFLKDAITVKTWCLYEQTPGFLLPIC